MLRNLKIRGNTTYLLKNDERKVFMNYSAGMASRPFWYIESKKTAKYMQDGLNKEEIRKIVIEENIYQAPSEDRVERIFNTIFRRLSSLDAIFLERITSVDVATSKILVLFSIMKTDRLFFEFMFEVYREKLILGDYTVKERDINVFFENKKRQSDSVSKWTEYTVQKLKACYTRMLFESGLTPDNSADRKIAPINIDYKLIKELKDKDMSAFLQCIAL
jgi:hypothetical protein